jgi:hypothetical protein
MKLHPIEKNVPLPPKSSPKRPKEWDAYFDKLELHDSFQISECKPDNVSNKITALHRSSFKRFKLRRIDETTVRVWRVK